METERKKLLISALKKFVIDLLRSMSVQTILKLLLKSPIATGFRAWLIKFAVTELYNEIAEPIIKASFIEIGYQYDKHEGQVIIKKIKDAKNANDYNVAVDDIFS